MALEKYTVKGYSPKEKTVRPSVPKRLSITSEDYRDLASLLNRVIIRVSTNIVDFNSIRGSETLETIRKFFHQVVRLRVEQMIANQNDTQNNRSTRPDATPHMQHMVLVQGDGGQTVIDAFKISNEQVQSGYRSYFYDRTVIHWFQPDEDSEVYQKLMKQRNLRIILKVYPTPFDPTPELLENLVQEAMRAYLGHPYLYIQAKDNIYPESLKGILQYLKYNLPLLYENGLQEVCLAREEICLNICRSENEINDLQITSFPRASKCFYKGDMLPPRYFDQMINLLQMGATYQVMGWLIFEKWPEKVSRHPLTLLLQDHFEQVLQPQQFYSVMGHIAMNMAEIRGMLPVIFDENDRAVLLLVGEQQVIDLAIREMIDQLKA